MVSKSNCFKNSRIGMLIFISCCTFVVLNACAQQSKNMADKTAEKKGGTTVKATKETPAGTKAASTDENVLYSIDFENAAKKKGDARKWLTSEGFEFQSGASSQKKVNISFNKNALCLKTKSGVFGLIMKKIKIKDAGKIRIVWGVDKFPKGASYKKGVNNEAVMIYVYFGTKKMSSGSMFIPNSPYFLGLFLGENEDLNKPCVGKHFKESGRFICVAMPKKGETVTTEFDLNSAFKECFTKEKTVPAIFDVAIEAETSNSGDASAFIKKIEFLK